jgi:hypothetical protein
MNRMPGNYAEALGGKSGVPRYTKRWRSTQGKRVRQRLNGSAELGSDHSFHYEAIMVRVAQKLDQGLPL